MRKISILLLLFFVLLAAGFTAWAGSPARALPAAEAALASSSTVMVERDRWLAFIPVHTAPTTGLIFYPGGRVEPEAYAPAMRQIAEQGSLVVIVPMPLNLAVLAPNRAAQVMAAFPEVERWAVGGHSLGGAMAAEFAGKDQAGVNGLVLWASYPADSNDLSNSDLEVVSVYGTLDGLVSAEKLEASRLLLPAATNWAAIEGGNHAQFGLYGPQSGDNPADIDWQAQQNQAVAATLDLLNHLDRRNP